jgi:hypothetical protein
LTLGHTVFEPSKEGNNTEIKELKFIDAIKKKE